MAFKDALHALTTYWGVESWDDLAIFSSNDLAEAITEASNYGELDTPIHHKHLGFLLDYAYSENHYCSQALPCRKLSSQLAHLWFLKIPVHLLLLLPPLLLPLDIQLRGKLSQLWTISLARMRTIFLGVKSP